MANSPRVGGRGRIFLTVQMHHVSACCIQFEMVHHLDLAGALICLLAPTVPRLCDCSKQMRGSLYDHNIERSDDSARCCVRGWFYRHVRRFNSLYAGISLA